MFLLNTPDAISELTAGTPFRFLFHHDEFRTDINVTLINVLPHAGGPSIYPFDTRYT